MKWRLNVNKSTSQFINLWGSRITQSNFKLKHGVLDIASDYKQNRLIKINPERLTKHMFLNEFNSDSHRKNWTNEIKHMFYKINLHAVYQQQRIGDLQAFKVKLRFDKEKNWKHYVIHKPKLRQYVHFKSNYEMEPSINLVSNKFELISLRGWMYVITCFLFMIISECICKINNKIYLT